MRLMSFSAGNHQPTGQKRTERSNVNPPLDHAQNDSLLHQNAQDQVHFKGFGESVAMGVLGPALNRIGEWVFLPESSRVCEDARDTILSSEELTTREILNGKRVKLYVSIIRKEDYKGRRYKLVKVKLATKSVHSHSSSHHRSSRRRW